MCLTLPGELAEVKRALACGSGSQQAVHSPWGRVRGSRPLSVCGSDCVVLLLGILEGETSEVLEICILLAGCSVGLRGCLSLEAACPSSCSSLVQPSLHQ